MVTSIAIDPPLAGVDGCTATVEKTGSETVEWYNSRTEYDYYDLRRTVVHGWLFSHWEWVVELESFDTRSGQHTIDHITGRDSRKIQSVYESVYYTFSPYDYEIYFTSYRRITSVKAVFTSYAALSAIQFNTSSNPTAGGVTTGDGLFTGYVGNTQTLTATATPNTGYAFVKWVIDNQDYTTKSVTFERVFKSGYTSSNPEIVTGVAHFRETTGLILRSSASGIILRGSSGQILRDE